jgi:hypothetical protein
MHAFPAIATTPSTITNPTRNNSATAFIMSGATLPTKKIFLAQNVIPANDNDDFNDNKCTFCWGPYDDDHPGVRVLPCNHVFGRECLEEMIKASNGDHCPICRTPLFRPPLKVALERCLAFAVQLFALFLISIIHACNVALYGTGANTPPYWLRLCFQALYFLGRFWLNYDNPFWHAQLLIDNCTGL